jgi:hypothetical protein
MANEAVPLFRPGSDVTCLTTGAVTGKRIVDTTTTVDATTGMIKVAHCAAGVRGWGVAAYDAGSGARVPVIAGPGTIVHVTSGAAITVGAEVEVGTTGRVITLASGKAVGKALSTVGGADLDVLVRLY